MAETLVSATVDDDLPRTFRREKEAQARIAREREQGGEAFGAPETFDEPSESYRPEVRDYYDPQPVTVTGFDVPFLHLMMFLIKAVFAAVPALILLIAMLWGLGEILTVYFPDLVKMQILIRMPH